MGIEEIFESGFVKAFIAEYYEYKIHSYYPDKDRLHYILCNSEAEKIEVTNKQIEYTKSEIINLGWEALSFLEKKLRIPLLNKQKFPYI